VLAADPDEFTTPGALKPGPHAVQFKNVTPAPVAIRAVDLLVCGKRGWTRAGKGDPIRVIADGCSGRTLMPGQSCTVKFNAAAGALKAELAPRDSTGAWLHALHIAR
jgi:hypothetical protein